MAFFTLTPSAPRGNVPAIGQMLIAGLFFSAMHTSIRYLGMVDGMHPFEIAFFRNFFGLIVILPWVVRFGLRTLSTSRIKLHLLRASVSTASMLCGFYAFTIAPLAQVTALGFSGPIFATVLAVAFLSEKVGFRRWTAILTGFFGTLVAVKFGISGIELGPALAIAGAVGGGINICVVKVLGRTESAVTITAYMSLLMAPMSLIPALFFWEWPSLTQLVWLAFIGIAGNIGQILLVQALHDGDTNVVMPFDYVRLLWVAILSFFAFGEIPDGYTWSGGTIIFASAAYIAYRERYLAKQATATGKAKAYD